MSRTSTSAGPGRKTSCPSPKMTRKSNRTLTLRRPTPTSSSVGHRVYDRYWARGLTLTAERDEANAIDKSNIIESRLRGGKPAKGAMAEPGDEEGLPTDD